VDASHDGHGASGARGDLHIRLRGSEPSLETDLHSVNRPSAGNRFSSGTNRPTARSWPARQQIANRPSLGRGPVWGRWAGSVLAASEVDACEATVDAGTAAAESALILPSSKISTCLAVSTTYVGVIARRSRQRHPAVRDTKADARRDDNGQLPHPMG